MGQVPLAESLLAAAQPVMEAEDLVTEEAKTLQYRAIAAVESGHPDRARRLFERGVARARASGRDEVLFSLLANLGAFETREQYNERALRVYASLDSVVRRGANPRRRAWLMERRAHALVRLQRLNEAVLLADSATTIAEEIGEVVLANGSRLVSGWALSNLRSYAESNRRLRRILSRPNPGLAVTTLSAAATVADNLWMMDSLDAALATVQAYLPLADEASVNRASYLRLRAGSVLLDAGRPGAADAYFAEALRRSSAEPFHTFKAELLVGRARAAQSVGRFVNTARYLEAAGESWREARRRSGTNEFRERLATIGAEIAGASMISLAGGDTTIQGVAKAFDVAERYKALNLVDRLASQAVDSTGSDEAIRAVTLQQKVLLPGELLVDLRMSDAGCGAFAINRDRIRYFPIELPARTLAQQVREWRQLLIDPDVVTSDVRATTKAIADVVLGPVAELLQTASSVVVAPEGALHLAPFRLLVAAAAFDGDVAATPPVSVVPSATVLALARRATHPRPIETLLACAGTNAPGNERPLAGARNEVSWLSKHFEGAIAMDPNKPVEGRPWPESDVLHLAGHMRADDGAPWRSAVRLSLDGPEGEPELRADRVASMSIRAQLVVLASCTTIGEAVLAGEGVAGMATAFLAAGAPTVVATLWPVDDRATAYFTREFYEGLADGLTVGDAVGRAQRDLAKQARFRDPRFWAGYVVVGNPATRVGLTRKSPWPPPAMLVVLMVFVGAIAMLLIRLRGQSPPG